MFIEKRESISKAVLLHVEKWGTSFIDAVLAVCEENNIEPEAAAKYLTKPILEKITKEAKDLHFLENIKDSLPFE